MGANQVRSELYQLNDPDELEELEKLRRDPELQAKIARLKKTDNYTNFLPLLGIYFFLAVGIGGALWFYHLREVMGFSFWWNVPVTLLAIFWVGVGQHRLGGLAHDALHHQLFKNRYLNEIISDVFCMLPILSFTYFFRLEHLGHHQKTNDRNQDPDVALLKEAGFWIEGPLEKNEIFSLFLKMLNPIQMVKYMAIRSKYASLYSTKHAFRSPEAKLSYIYLYNISNVLWLIGMFVLMVGLAWWSDLKLYWLLPPACYGMFVVFYLLLPKEAYRQSRFHPVIPLRILTLMRLTYVFLVFWGLGWLSFGGTPWALFYFILLWAVPMFTSFSFLTILQQAVQHANANRGWATNSRVFVLNPLLQFCLFPMGLGYHQSHHMFPPVPYYHLENLHHSLSQYPAYRKTVTVVRGLLFPPWGDGHQHPTLLEALGPRFAPRGKVRTFVDDTVLENDTLEELKVALS